MFLDEEIDRWWCLCSTWRCTLSEASGLWSVMLFYTSVFVVTLIHLVVQSHNGTLGGDSRPRELKKQDNGGELSVVIALLVYFFTFVAGCLSWVLVGVRSVHPFQFWPVQLIGSTILLICTALFVVAHFDLGDSWSPQPERKTRHQLVTHGLFSWARHPMYAIFLWASIGTSLATLNWLIAWCVFGSVPIVLNRIDTEERILLSLFGQQYAQYRLRVSALGPPWRCLGYDRIHKQR